MKLVFVEWSDSRGASPRWQHLDGFIMAPVICKSVGWLQHQDEAMMVIVPHVATGDPLDDTDQQGCGGMAIPVHAVIKMTVLGEPPGVIATEMTRQKAAKSNSKKASRK